MSVAANGPGRVSSSLLAATLMPCAHTSVFFGCARGSLGLLRAEGLDVDEPGTSGAIWGAVGARIGVEVPLSEMFALRFHGDGDVVLTRYALRFGDRTAFRYAPVAAGLGIAALATF
jgi:hypothetical protein